MAVVGEDAFEFESASDAAEKYADVGVGVTVDCGTEATAGASGRELVCSVGRVGGEPCAGRGGEPGRELLKSRLRRFPPEGLGLRLLKRDMGLVKPLW